MERWRIGVMEEWSDGVMDERSAFTTIWHERFLVQGSKGIIQVRHCNREL
jgi:hypothetical protein